MSNHHAATDSTAPMRYATSMTRAPMPNVKQIPLLWFSVRSADLPVSQKVQTQKQEILRLHTCASSAQMKERLQQE